MATSQQDEGTLAEKNQKFWKWVLTRSYLSNIAPLTESNCSTRAQDLYQTQWVKDLQQQISSHLLSNLDWLGIKSEKQEKMLDYACGHGIASQVSPILLQKSLRLWTILLIARVPPKVILTLLRHLLGHRRLRRHGRDLQRQSARA